MSERRKIVVWWREGIATILLIGGALILPHRFMVAMLGLGALANLGLAVLAECDATSWHRAWRGNYENLSRVQQQEGESWIEARATQQQEDRG